MKSCAYQRIRMCARMCVRMCACMHAGNAASAHPIRACWKDLTKGLELSQAAVPTGAVMGP